MTGPSPESGPVLQLLASSTGSDVTQSIAMLLTCKQFEVDGAGDTIRRMLPLIFTKDQCEWQETSVGGRAGGGACSRAGASVQGVRQVAVHCVVLAATPPACPPPAMLCLM